MPPTIVVLCGPTAAGKTRLGVELALRLHGEVVSADSMQIYRGMDIGTAKPTPEERRGVPHHMLDVVSPEEAYSVARYTEDATRCIDDILARGKLPILVGGTGLYIDAVCSGHSFAAPETGQRARLQAIAQTEGIDPLWTTLQRVDPETAARLHPNDEKRVIRALEVFYETGKPISLHNQETQRLPPRYTAHRIGLNFADRAQLYARIDARVEEMLRLGLLEEVRRLLAMGLSPACTAMQAIGYKEFAQAVTEQGDLQAAVETLKLRSRQYAKRQLTWFRRNPAIHWFLWTDTPDFSSAIQDSTAFLSHCGLG